MVNYSQRIIIVGEADLSENVSLIFLSKMCIFVSRPIDIVTFHWKNDVSPKRLLIFFRIRHMTKNMEIVEDFVEKSYNDNGNP